MSLLPTIVLVHGAWHTPYHYQPYITALEQRGFVVHCPLLPSSNGVSPPTASLAEDVRCVGKVVESLVNSGKRVLMIMHSYGGLVGANAIEGFSRAERQKSGRPGGVIHLLYLCGYLLMPGETIWGKVEAFGFASLWPQFMNDAPDGTTFPKDPALWFYGGIDKKVIDGDLVPRLVCAPLSIMKAEAQAISWKNFLPATYVFTQQDYAVPRDFQTHMVSRARDHGVSLRTEDYDTSHSIFLTRTAEMVQAAERAAEDERNVY
ncbi:alpha/beta-hydrolase [Aspergillus ambiguus]|uniref:alpha/beta hydrolase n=1 Tax=Aspergillus ambiguus TaxID=176160 RepID=UPI003CCDAC3A